MDLTNGLVAAIEDKKLVLKYAGGEERVLEEIDSDHPPPWVEWLENAIGCAPETLGILGSVDGKYLLYHYDGYLWIYGVAEHRKALLSRGYDGSLIAPFER